MQPDPVLIRIGPIAIYWYGVLIVSGAVLAAYIASRLSSRNGHDPEISWNLLLVVLFTGVIGARIYHIISSWDYYRMNPGEMFGLQMSGFGIYGAVLGGLVGLWGFAKYYKLRFLEWSDYVAPGLLLAQAIGRWGNFFNKELFGPPTDLPWGIYIPPENRVAPGLPAEYANFEYFHPTFFYESSLNFIGFLVLLYLARNWRRNGCTRHLFRHGLIYPVIRFSSRLFPAGHLENRGVRHSPVGVDHPVRVLWFADVAAQAQQPSMVYTFAPWSPMVAMPLRHPP